VLVIRDAFKSLPRDIEEAATIDGCSSIGVIRRIALFLIAPAATAVFILIFSFSWNEFLSLSCSPLRTRSLCRCISQAL